VIDGLDKDASQKGTLAAVSYTVGGLALALGVTLYVLSAPDEGTSASFSPYLTPYGGGVVGRF
jgi:hypothetical protein